jgi:hypothetical protein
MYLPELTILELPAMKAEVVHIRWFWNEAKIDATVTVAIGVNLVENSSPNSSHRGMIKS